MGSSAPPRGRAICLCENSLSCPHYRRRWASRPDALEDIPESSTEKCKSRYSGQTSSQNSVLCIEQRLFEFFAFIFGQGRRQQNSVQLLEICALAVFIHCRDCQLEARYLRSHSEPIQKNVEQMLGRTAVPLALREVTVDSSFRVMG